MKTSLIIFGIIFLVLGGIFYLNPTQSASATTTTQPTTGAADVRTSTASIQVPAAVTLAMLLIGSILLILGFVLGNQGRRTRARSSTTVHSREQVDSGNGRKQRSVSKKIVRREQ
jgi:hypothetical protein